MIDQLAKTWTYPGGELGVRALQTPKEITCRIQSNDDLIRLIMYLHAAKGTTAFASTNPVQVVTIPYLPYARQDRIAHPGDPNAIEVLASMLAPTGVQFWRTFDVHSNKSRQAFLARGLMLDSLSPVDFIKSYMNTDYVAKNRKVYLVSPDEGARSKVELYSKQLDVCGVIYCKKVRDPNTGMLSKFEVSEGPEITGVSTHLMITDDICDGGGTFQGVAEIIRKEYNPVLPLHLWTTHGIYSKGLDELMKTFQTVGSTNSFLNYQTHNRLCTIDFETGRLL